MGGPANDESMIGRKIIEVTDPQINMAYIVQL